MSYALVLLISLAQASPQAITGLIGKATYQTQALTRDLDAVESAGRIAKAVLDDIIARHTQVGRDLRTAFALSAVEHRPVPAFYYAALSSHRLLNDRLLQLTDGTPDRARVVAALGNLPGIGY